MFRSRLSQLMSDQLRDREEFPFELMLNLVNEGLAPQHQFSAEEARVACQPMVDQSEIFIDAGTVYVI